MLHHSDGWMLHHGWQTNFHTSRIALALHPRGADFDPTTRETPAVRRNLDPPGMKTSLRRTSKCHTADRVWRSQAQCVLNCRSCSQSTPLLVFPVTIPPLRERRERHSAAGLAFCEWTQPANGTLHRDHSWFNDGYLQKLQLAPQMSANSAIFDTIAVCFSSGQSALRTTPNFSS